nr:PREDICTED: uncharacterized protein LOC109434872 isoform X4 [Rhinolophus sinicus]
MWAQGAAPSPPSWHLLCSGPVSTSLLSRDSSCVTRCDFTSYIASQGDTPGSPLPEARIQGNGLRFARSSTRSPVHCISSPPSVRGACIPDLQVETEAQAGLNCSCAVNPELDSDRLGPSILDPLLTTSQRPGQVRGVASLFRAPAPSSGNPNVLLCKAASVSGVLMLEEVIHTCGTSERGQPARSDSRPRSLPGQTSPQSSRGL